ncbi:MAG: hypothetical protein LZ172_03390 [Thaumarchaeota archaeon]|nr:hypothetical protein [Candidatus Geocrenenecus arthurdayi]
MGLARAYTPAPSPASPSTSLSVQCPAHLLTVIMAVELKIYLRDCGYSRYAELGEV